MKQSEVIKMVEQAQDEAKNMLANKLMMKYGPTADIFAEDVADYIFGHQAGQDQGLINLINKFNS